MRIAAISHDPAARDILMGLTDLPAPWGWYLAQSAFAAAPDGDLAERLPAHMIKALREAKEDTFWTAPNAAFEETVTDAARAIATRLPTVAEELEPLAERARNMSLVQCALKLTIPGIPDIYQGTEIGSYRLTDPDNRVLPVFERIAGDDLDAFDARKLSLTRRMACLRRERPELFEAPYVPIDGTAGLLSFARGALTVETTVNGTPLPGLEAPLRLTLDGDAFEVWD